MMVQGRKDNPEVSRMFDEALRQGKDTPDEDIGDQADHTGPDWGHAK